MTSTRIAELVEESRRIPRRPRAFGAARGLYSVRAQEDGADIYLYSEIGGWFGTTAEQFIADLRALRGARVRVHINSPGGDVFDGLAIYNTLKAYEGSSETIIEGLAASIASVIALAGDTVTMARASLLMIHDPWGLCVGTAQEMLEMAAVLEKAAGVLADVYQQKSAAPLADVTAWMTEETWFTAEEARAAGLVDAVSGAAPEEALAARVRFDLSAYRHTPASLRAAPSPAPDPDAALARQRDWVRGRRIAFTGTAA